MRAPEAVRVGMYPALEEGANLGLKGPGYADLLGPRDLELRGTSSTAVAGLTHCSTAAEECHSLFLNLRKKQETVKWAAGERNEKRGEE